MSVIRDAPDLVDAHAHLVSAARARRNQAESGPSRLSRPYGLDDLWAAQPRRIPVVLIESDRPEPGENERLLAFAADGADVLAVIGRLDLAAPTAETEIERITALPSGGRWRGPRFALRTDIEDRWNANARQATALLAATGRILEILTPAARIPDAAAIAASAECRVVIDHLGLPPWSGSDDDWARWERDIAALARISHTVTKFSHLPAERGDPGIDARLHQAGRHALEVFGPNRMMYASNWPWPPPDEEHGEEYPMVAAQRLAAELTPAEATAFFAGTALQTYRPDLAHAQRAASTEGA